MLYMYDIQYKYTLYLCTAFCHRPCQNGGTCDQGGVCQCHSGYTGESNTNYVIVANYIIRCQWFSEVFCAKVYNVIVTAIFQVWNARRISMNVEWVVTIVCTNALCASTLWEGFSVAVKLVIPEMALTVKVCRG